MDWTEILQNLFVVVIIPLLGLITKYMVQFFAIKNEELKEKNENATIVRSVSKEEIFSNRDHYIAKEKNIFLKLFAAIKNNFIFLFFISYKNFVLVLHEDQMRVCERDLEESCFIQYPEKVIQE